jgi:hypothetical protein
MRNYKGKFSTRLAAGLVFCVCVAVVLGQSVPNAQSAELTWDDDYPGRFSDGSGSVNVASQMVQSGLQGYYRVFGVWPDSWQAVINAGLFQTQLVGYQLEAIDPDDPELTFYGDLYYDSTTKNDEKVRLFELMELSGPSIESILVAPSPPYSILLDTIWRDSGGVLERDKYLGDVRWLKFLSIRAGLNSSIGIFRMTHRRYPADLDELFDSGVSLVDRASINPLTGEEFQFDGSEFDYYYELIDEERFEFYHTEESGRRATTEFAP